MAKRGKKYLEAAKLVDSNKKYTLEEAVALVKKTSYTKFDATVEVAYKLNIDPRKADQNLRGAISLPNGTGKDIRVLVIAKETKAKEALDAGANYAGDTEYLEKIKGGWFDFDMIIATPDMMGELGKLGRILGPKGLMPNPKTGTVTMDVTKAINEIKSGKVEYRLDKSNIIHLGFGKVSFGADKLAENYDTVMDAIVKAKPSAAKGTYIKSAYLTSVAEYVASFAFCLITLPSSPSSHFQSQS